MITKLKPNDIFVFGSNGQGHHGAGAAKFALDKGWTELGNSHGLSQSGKAYAIDTMDGLRQFHEDLARLFLHANLNKQNRFLLTPVGTGIAGYSKSDVLYLIEQASREVHHDFNNSNVIFTEEWNL